MDTVLASVRKTHRVLVVEEQKPFCGVGAQLAYMIQSEAFDELDAPIARLSTIDAPAIYSPPVEVEQLPNPQRILKAAVEADAPEPSTTPMANIIEMPKLSDTMTVGHAGQVAQEGGRRGEDRRHARRGRDRQGDDGARELLRRHAAGDLRAGRLPGAAGRGPLRDRQARARRSRPRRPRPPRQRRQPPPRAAPRRAARPRAPAPAHAAPAAAPAPQPPPRRPARPRQDLPARPEARRREGRSIPSAHHRKRPRRPHRQGRRRSPPPRPAPGRRPARSAGAAPRPRQRAPSRRTGWCPSPTCRATIARRLVESKTQIPHFYLEIEIDAEPLLELRAQLNAALEKEGVKLSVNDFILKASAEALRRVPAVNCSWEGAADPPAPRRRTSPSRSRSRTA